jgi:hypothetical protein
VTAVDRNTGKILWQTNTHSKIISGPAVGNDVVTVTSGSSITSGSNPVLHSTSNTGFTLHNDGIIEYTGNSGLGDAVHIGGNTGDVIINNSGVLTSATSAGVNSDFLAAGIQIATTADLGTVTINNSGEVSGNKQGIIFGTFIGSFYDPVNYSSSNIINSTGGIIQSTKSLGSGLGVNTLMMSLVTK